MKKKYILFLIFSLCSLQCFGDSSYTGKITKIHNGPGVGTKVYLTLDGDQSNKPSCATSGTYNYVFDGSTEGGKILISIALTAYSSGKTVYIGGYETCGLYSGVEDLKWLRVQ